MLYTIACRDKEGVMQINLSAEGRRFKMIHDACIALTNQPDSIQDGRIFYPMPLNTLTYKMASPLEKLELTCKRLGIPIDKVPDEGVSASLLQQLDTEDFPQ